MATKIMSVEHKINSSALFVAVLISFVTGTFVKPNLKTQECLKISHFIRDPNVFLCKDLGLCYKHYCKQITRRCQVCQKHTHTSCPLNQKNENYEPRVKGGDDRIKFQSYTEKDSSILSNTSRRQVLVRIEAGNTECSGVFVKILVEGKRVYAILTSGKCLVDFQVKCQIFMDNNTVVNENTPTCFIHSESQINKVTKEFRSYFVNLYHGERKLVLPLNSKTTLISKDFMECMDCRYDIAALRLRSQNMAKLNMSKTEAFVVKPVSTHAIPNKTVLIHHLKLSRPAFSDMKDKTTITKVGKLIHLEKHKMCLTIIGNDTRNPGRLIGSAVVVYNPNRTFSERVSGIITHVTAYSSSKSILELSAVRLTHSFLKHVEKWLAIKWKRKYCSDPEYNVTLHSRYNCFSALGDFNKNLEAVSPLCMCARGWKNERSACKEPQTTSLNGCKWEKGMELTFCSPGFIQETSTTYSLRRFLDEVRIPGSSKRWHLLSTNIDESVKLKEILRHLTLLEELVLNQTHLEIIHPDTLARSFRLRKLLIINNNLTRVHRNTFRHNKLMEYISLENNRLSSISRATFRKQEKLQHLNLQRNLIERLSKRSFVNCILLTRINLSYNRLESLPPSTFSFNIALTEAYLDHNLLKSIPSKLFRKCTRLRVIKLEGNKLTSIPGSIFDFNPALAIVNFGNNSLIAIPKKIFKNQKSLEAVTFQNNPKLPTMLTLSTFVTNTSTNQLKERLQTYGSSKLLDKD